MFSFHEVSLKGVRGYVGLDNYKHLFTPEVGASLYRTSIYVIGSVPVAMGLGVIGALLLNQDFKSRNILRVLCFIPWILPHSILAVIWRWTLHPAYGLLNNILLSMGITSQGISFLTVENAMTTVIGIRIWRASTFAIICTLAALQAIPKELNEAAMLDGARKDQQFLYVTLPIIWPMLKITTLFLMIWTFVIFDMVYVLTGGGPVEATELIAIKIFTYAFGYYKIGIASAISVGIIILLLFTFIFLKLQTRE